MKQALVQTYRDTSMHIQDRLVLSIPGLMPDDFKVFAGSGRAGVTVSEMRMEQRQRQAVALSTSSNTARKRFDVRDR
jgi:hypothetical protein